VIGDAGRSGSVLAERDLICMDELRP
jgi:hypothetical protein